jgi:hypothetical protein
MAPLLVLLSSPLTLCALCAARSVRVMARSNNTQLILMHMPPQAPDNAGTEEGGAE